MSVLVRVQDQRQPPVLPAREQQHDRDTHMMAASKTLETGDVMCRYQPNAAGAAAFSAWSASATAARVFRVPFFPRPPSTVHKLKLESLHRLVGFPAFGCEETRQLGNSRKQRPETCHLWPLPASHRLISTGLYTPSGSCRTSNGPSHFKVVVAAFTSSDELAMAVACCYSKMLHSRLLLPAPPFL